MRIVFILILCCMGVRGVAQYSFSQNVSGSINVFTIQSLTLSGGTVTPSFTTMEHYFSGVVLQNYITVSVRSNGPWTVSVQAQNQYFTPMSQGGSTNMPAGVLSLRRENQVNFTPVSVAGHTLKSGGKGGATAPGNTFTIDMKFNPGFGYKGGIYTLGLMYTLSQQ